MAAVKRILVVDDEEPNRELLEAIMTSFGHEVDMAADGAEALAKLDATHDLILLDVMMSGIDGFEVARRIRAGSDFSDVPICMVTALSGKEQRLLAVEAGANDFIAKPIDRTELKIRSASLLRTKEAQDMVKQAREVVAARNLALQQSYEELARLGDLKDEFIRIASHDLKNPLTCILGFASLIKNAIPPGTEMNDKFHALLPRIIHHTQTMQKIIGDFLDFQTLRDGEINVVPEPVDLNAMARACVGQNEAYAEGKGIALALELADDLPAALADAGHIGQVMDNFVGNAVKFGSAGGRVVARTRSVDGRVVFEVSDAGPGLTEEDVGRLFVNYAKLSNKPTGGEKSTGLGLAICKRMITLNGGEIGGRNNEDRGATFWFSLPTESEALRANEAESANIGYSAPFNGAEEG